MKQKLNNAMKWSLFTELIVKIISPVTNMILARLLNPEAFGIVASLMIITSFSEMIADAGFQKFLIHYQFKDDNELVEYASVAFWTNFIISILIYFFIFVFSNSISNLVNLPNYIKAIRVYSLIIILIPLSSINYTMMKKKYEYKSLGLVRVIFKIIPFCITIPLSFLGFSYWSLIFGGLIGEFANSFFSFYISKYKIKFFFSKLHLKKMYKFCLTVSLETFSSWLMSNISILIVGYTFGTYMLGIYKVSITTVNQIVSIVTAATISIIFTQLSDYQNDNIKFVETILYYQRKIGFFTIPMGLLMFLFKDIIVMILLGESWVDANFLIGAWGFVLCESVIFADIGSIATIAKGKPINIFYSNLIQVFLLLIFSLFVNKLNFYDTIVVLCIIRVQLTVTHFYFAKQVSNIKIKDVIYNIYPYVLSTFIMYISYNLLNKIVINRFISIFTLLIIYIIILLTIPKSRKEIFLFLNFERN